MPETFGQVNLRLSKMPHGAGVDPVLRQGIVNDRLQAIYRAYDWTRLQETDAVLSTVAVYETGTVTIANGATSGTGTSTVFTAAMTGRRIRITGQNESYVFTFLTSTTFTIDRAFEGDSQTDATYRIYQNVYSLASDVGQLDSIRVLDSSRDLDMLSIEDLDKLDPARLTYGDPEVYALYEDGESHVPQVELWPVPDEAEGLLYRYRKSPERITATNSVIPAWVSIECLIAGCEADLYALKENLAMAQVKEAQYQRYLSEMVREDSQRKPSQQLRMHPVFTEHRRARSRGTYRSHRWIQLHRSE